MNPAEISVIPVLVGPTASGKTQLSLRLAEMLKGVQIISADSRQVYVGMDIGTAKASRAERDRVPHHMIDIITPDVAYSAGKFAFAARTVIEDILEQGGIPLVVGGSGFYIQALFEGLNAPAAESAVYAELESRGASTGYDVLYEELQRVDPIAAAAHSPNNHAKTLRALACYIQTGRPYSSFIEDEALGRWRHVARYFAIAPPRRILYERINSRTREMIEEGLIAETAGLLEKGYTPESPGLRTVGYREVAQYLRGQLDLDETVGAVQQATRRYAKRQMTWFRRVSEISWGNEADVATIVREIETLRS